MRLSSSDASGSSISRRRGEVSKARPIATRCFSPPDKAAGAAIQERPDVEQVEHLVEADMALARAA